MNDIIYILVMIDVLAFTMKKHGKWTKINGLGDFIGWFMVSALLLRLTRWPILGIWEGFSFPQKSTALSYNVSAILAIAIWFAMMYWRLPGRVLALTRGH